MVVIQTVSSKNAPVVLKSWEQEDSYYSGMKNSVAGPLNMSARRHPYLQTSEGNSGTREVYFEYPLEGPIQVVYLDALSDAGLPHTRGKKGIALPVFLLWEPSEKTMRHELVHLSQKQYRNRWLIWYAKFWSFRPATMGEFIQIPFKWRSRRRINPDTLGVQYAVWKNRYIPLSVFSNELSPDLRFCKRGFWDLVMTQWTWETPSGWEDTFGTGFNDEHPHEIAAHWIDGSAGIARQKYFNDFPI
jgi:hypothetical protein